MEDLLEYERLVYSIINKYRKYGDYDDLYQVGMMGKLDVVIDENGVKFENIDTEMIINYFDDDSRNFELVPFNQYDEDYEKSHQRHDLGLTKEWIENTFKEVVDEKYR